MTDASNTMTDEVKYDERYCAYVDILGFRDLVSTLSDKSRGVRALRNLLTTIHEPFSGPATTDFRAQSISDAVALSTAVNSDGLFHLFSVLERLTIDLLFEGYFTRGAIAKGRLYHDDKMAFGEALITAFAFESQVANFPRIVLTRAVADDARTYWECRFSKRVLQAEDGPYYLHVLHRLTQDLDAELRRSPDAGAGRSDEVRYWVQIETKIREHYTEAVVNPRHFEKVKWFARYWNSFISTPVIGFDRIRGPGLDGVTAKFLY
jgi:hypothetical protein